MQTDDRGRCIITHKTTLAELQKNGATTLSDIPIVELLEFVRNVCISAAADEEADGAIGWGEDFTEATCQVQNAIETLKKWF